MGERVWDIIQVDDPQLLVDASDLFDQPVDLDGARDFLNRPGHLCLLARRTRDGHPVGFVTGVEVCHPDKGVEMFVYELGVDESSRRRGIGAALVRALTEEARERGCYAVWTGFDPDNAAARRTYQKSGAHFESFMMMTIDDLGER